MSFTFNPIDGYNNVTTFPTKPANETVFRSQMMTLLNQIRDYINNEVWSDGNNTASLSQNGYQQLASGMIMQWGVTGNIPQNTANTITLPIAFPGAFRGCTATVQGTTSPGVSINNFQLTSFDIYHNDSASRTVRWIAFGY